MIGDAYSQGCWLVILPSSHLASGLGHCGRTTRRVGHGQALAASVAGTGPAPGRRNPTYFAISL
jgi:hypothetical protein